MTNENHKLIVFDIDGTILPGTSFERLFVEHLFQKRILRPRHAFYFMRRGLTLLLRSLTSVTKANKGYLKNFTVDYMTKLGEEFFNATVAPRISKTAVEQIKLHQKNGERVILLSGMPDFLCGNFARYLGVAEFYGSVTETKDGKFTGRTLGPFPLGRGKIKALQEIVGQPITRAVGSPDPTYDNGQVRPPDRTVKGSVDAKWCRVPDHSVVRMDAPDTQRDRQVRGPDGTIPDWSAVTFYGDHWLDRFLLEKVGHPVAVNPREKLLQLAKEKGWQVEWWG